MKFLQRRLCAAALAAICAWISILALPFPASAKKEVLNVGIFTDAPPISFKRESDQTVRGIAVDMALLMGKSMGMDIQFHGISRSDISRAMAAGKIDAFFFALLGNDFRKQFDYLPTGLVAERSIFVCDTCRTITCIMDFPGHTVVYLDGDPFISTLRTLNNVELVKAHSYAEALQIVNKRQAAAFVSPSRRTALYLLENYRLKNVRQVGVSIENNPLAILLPKGDSDLFNILSVNFTTMMEHGNAELIIDKWLGKSPNLDLLKKYTKYTLISFSIAFMVILFGGVWNYLLKKKVNQITKDLSRTEQRYRTLIESSPDMVFMLNSTGQIIQTNKAAKDEFLFKNLNSESCHLHDFVREDNRQGFDEFLTEIINKGCARNEFWFHNEDSGMNVEIVGTTTTENCPVTGRPLICCFARDVTERNIMEQELIQAERLAVIGKMAASVAHEINNPLGIILANAEELSGGELHADDFTSAVAAIQRNAVQAGNITEGLLTLSSPKPFTEESINLVDLIDESISFLWTKMKNINLNIDSPEDGLWIKGDSMQLQQLFMNLFLNSIKAMECKNSGTISVKARISGKDEDRTARIVVKDDGIGIPRENLSQIFEPFFSQSKNGFGLGLFICRRIVEKHDGIIFAESEPGEGSQIIIELKA